MTEDEDPFKTARDAQTRVTTLLTMQLEAREVRDYNVKVLLRAGYRVNEIARQIGCIEGTVRQIKRKMKGEGTQ